MPNQITPEEVPGRLVEVAEEHYDTGGAGLIRNVLAGVLPAAGEMIHADIAELFRRAAAGRREYAEGMPVRKAGMPVPDAHLAEMRETLLIEANCFESAALIVEDPRRVMDVIPSWRWTDDEAASIRMPEEAAPDPTTPERQDLRERTAEDLTSPETVGPAYAAVYEVIRRWPGSAERNAVVWRAVEAHRAALAEDPGDLPARMQAELDRHFPADREASLCACGAIEVFDWSEHIAAAAAGVRDEQMASLTARWGTERARADKAEVERDDNFGIIQQLSRLHAVTEGQLDLMTQMRDSEKARADAAVAQAAALQRELAQMRAERDSATGMAYAAESKRVALEAALDEIAPGEAERVQAAVSRRLVNQMCAALPSRPDDPEEIRRLAQATTEEKADER